MTSPIKIFLITGQVDIGIAGNQTLKNTIRYLSKNFELNIFSGVPNDYSGVLAINEVLHDFTNVEYHRLPKFLNWLHKIGRSAKNLGRKKKNLLQVQEDVEYFSDFNLNAQIFYFFSWLFYVFFETLRAFVASLKERPAIFYGYEIYGARVASILGKIFRRPVVTRFQGTVLEIRKKSRWKYYPHQVLGLKSPAQAIIMGNDGSYGKDVLMALGVPEDRIYFWMNGLDQNIVDFAYDPQRIKELKNKLNIKKKKVLISINRLIIWKRIDRIIYTMYKLKSDYKMDNIILLIIGDGPERKNLENLVDFYKVSDSVIFVDAVSHKDIGNYFSLADAILITNDMCFIGNQLLEALYFGCPMLTLKDRAVDKLLKNEYNAILVSPQQIEEELPKVVYRVLTDKKLAEKLRYNAKVTARKKLLSWQERMEKETNLIKGLVEK